MQKNTSKDIVSLIFGDSIVYGLYDKEFGGWVNRVRIKLEQRAKNNFIMNLGIPGQTSNDILNILELEIKNRYNTNDRFNLIFSFGIKDSLLLNKDVNYLKKFEDNLSKIINISKNYTNNIYFLGLLRPDINIRNEYILTNVEKIDNCIKNICEKKGIYYININAILTTNDLDDGLHPNSKGHQKISELILTKIY